MPVTDFIGPAGGGLVKAPVHADTGAFHRHAMGDLLPEKRAVGSSRRDGVQTYRSEGPHLFR